MYIKYISTKNKGKKYNTSQYIALRQLWDAIYALMYLPCMQSFASSGLFIHLSETWHIRLPGRAPHFCSRSESNFVYELHRHKTIGTFTRRGSAYCVVIVFIVLEKLRSLSQPMGDAPFSFSTLLSPQLTMNLHSSHLTILTIFKNSNQCQE